MLQVKQLLYFPLLAHGSLLPSSPLLTVETSEQNEPYIEILITKHCPILRTSYDFATRFYRHLANNEYEVTGRLKNRQTTVPNVFGA